MKIAVLSGKGGTGKTFVSVNLACCAQRAVYVDCDVEEPNGQLFLKPQITDTRAIAVTVPEIDSSLCTGCRKCVEFCRYNAMALVQDKLLIFPELCHSCGGCILFCPEKALHKKKRAIGIVEVGEAEQVSTFSGCLTPGEESGVPIIQELISLIPEQETAIIDCPPGSACIVMESIRDVDYCILVTEPTLFGVHNLAMVLELVRLFQKPFGVVLNKSLPGENPAKSYCQAHQIPILAEIPYEEALASLNSKGLVAVKESPRYWDLFRRLLFLVEKEAHR